MDMKNDAATTDDAAKAEANVGQGSRPATTFEASGAPSQVVSDVDPSHPAVDNDPRAGTAADQNKIDFNDPTLSGSDAVAKSLAGQAKGETTEG